MAAEAGERARGNHAMPDSKKSPSGFGRAESTRFRALIEHMADTVAVVTPEGRFLYQSPAGVSGAGLSETDILGRTLADFVIPDDHDALRRWLGVLVADPANPHPALLRLAAPDGGVRWIEGLGVNALDTPAIGGLLITGRDITNRILATEELRLAEARSRALVQAIPDLLFMLDSDGVFRDYHAPSTADLLVPPAAFIGKRVADVLPPQISVPFLAAMDTVRRTGAVVAFEYSLDSLPGTTSFFEGRVAPNGTGGYLVMARNVTDWKRAEHELTRLNQELETRIAARTADLEAANLELARAARMKDDFLASMSHELRTPLSAILGLSEALQEAVYGAITERQRRTLETIEKSGRDLLALLNDILDLTKIGIAKLELDVGPVSVATLCESSLRLVRQAAAKKQIELFSTLDPSVGTVRADGRRLKQALVNLLSNAIKFTPDGGRVGIKAIGDPERERLRLVVWDTGIGIAADDLPRLFRPFMQLDSRLSRPYGGSGLGLSLASRLVELHGGSITVESRPEQGSRFTVAIPWSGPAAPEPPPDQPRAAAPAVADDRLDHPTVLLVDDDVVTLQMLTDYLEAHGFRTLTALSGAVAIECARRAAPRLIVVDVQMPDMDGVELVRLLRAAPEASCVPIVVLTALVIPGDRERCEAAGATAYVSKPVPLAELLSIVRTALTGGPR